MYNNDMKFVDTHEWVRQESDDVVIIGITNHAQELLGDLVYVELPSVGSIVSNGDTIGVVESVKAASDLYSPLSGEIIAVNDEVATAGWIFKLKLANKDEVAGLMSADKYKSLIG